MTKNMSWKNLSSKLKIGWDVSISVWGKLTFLFHLHRKMKISDYFKWTNFWNSALFKEELCLLTQLPQAHEQRPFKQFLVCKVVKIYASMKISWEPERLKNSKLNKKKTFVFLSFSLNQWKVLSTFLQISILSLNISMSSP